VSRRGGYQAGAAALGGLVGLVGLAAIGVVVAAVTIGVAEAGGAARLAGAGVLDASVTGPATAVTYQVSGAGQRFGAARIVPRALNRAKPRLSATPSTSNVTCRLRRRH
jgi:hypothetical protein